MKNGNKYTEYDLQCAIVEYMQLQYPHAIINGSLGGIRLPIGLAVKAKKMGNFRSFPDLFIACPTERYHGLFIELKAPGVKIRKRNGDYVNEHIAEQAATLLHLRKLGYAAVMANTFDQVHQILESYFSGYTVENDMLEIA